MLASVMRQRPLPADVLTLIRIAAGCASALQESVQITGKDPAVVRAAAIFYIQQVLWTSEADHYRVLGLGSDATAAKLAEHLRWLMKWLHPDQGRADVRPAAMARVLRAWDAVKTPERRKRYDRSLSVSRPQARTVRRRWRPASLAARRIPWIARPAEARFPAWRSGVAVIAAAIAGVSSLLGDWISAGRDLRSQPRKASATAVRRPEQAARRHSNLSENDSN